MYLCTGLLTVVLFVYMNLNLYTTMQQYSYQLYDPGGPYSQQERYTGNQQELYIGNQQELYTGNQQEMYTGNELETYSRPEHNIGAKLKFLIEPKQPCSNLTGIILGN